MDDCHGLFILARRMIDRIILVVVSGPGEHGNATLAERSIFGGTYHPPRVLGNIDLGYLDAICTDVERPQNRPLFVAADPDDRCHSSSLCGNHEVGNRFHRKRTVLGVEDAEIHARIAKRVDHRR